jgi:hypothetical protein
LKFSAQRAALCYEDLRSDSMARAARAAYSQKK